MDQRSDAAGPPAPTLAHSRAQTRPPCRSRRSPQPSSPQEQQPQEACAPGAPGPLGPRSGADREDPVSSPPSPTTTLDGALRARPARGALLPSRPPVLRGGSSLVHQLLLALVCAGDALGSALGWGSPRVALIMGGFGLGAAAGPPARAWFPFPPRPRGPLPPGLAPL